MSAEDQAALEFALACASAAEDKKAEDVLVLDLRGISSFADFFVICSGTSEPQLKAIADSVRDCAREKFHRKPLNQDGFPASQWVVVDFGDVIVHTFHHESRAFYDLENLWKDAPILNLS
jgi:ribosome-associated protein